MTWLSTSLAATCCVTYYTAKVTELIRQITSQLKANHHSVCVCSYDLDPMTLT